MIHGLDRLRHESVIRGDDKHNDIRHIGSAGTHLRKSFMPGRINEGDRLPVDAHHRRTDILGDPARFSCRHMRLADRILQRCFPMVHMSHESHDRRTRLQITFIVFEYTIFRCNVGSRFRFRSRGFPSAPFVDRQRNAELRRNLFRNLIVYRLIDAGQNVHHHEHRNDFVGLSVDGFRQCLHDDGTLYMHLHGRYRRFCRCRRRDGRFCRCRCCGGADAVFLRRSIGVLPRRRGLVPFRSGGRNGRRFSAASSGIAFLNGRRCLFRGLCTCGGLFGRGGNRLGRRSFFFIGSGFFPACEFIEIGGHQFQFRSGNIGCGGPDRGIPQSGKLLQNITGRHAVLIGKRLHFHIFLFHCALPPESTIRQTIPNGTYASVFPCVSARDTESSVVCSIPSIDSSSPAAALRSPSTVR